MKTLTLTDDEALVLWFIGKNLKPLAETVTNRPRGRETVESLAAKLLAMAIDDNAEGGDES